MKNGFILFPLVLFAGCAREKFPLTSPTHHEATETRETVCHKGVDAFSKTVHPLLRRDCLPCHDVGGLSGKPHSVPDVEKSYTRVVGYVNWSLMEKSYFITKGGNRHCLLYGGNCVSTEEDIRKVVREWWEMGQKECPNFGTHVTRPEVVSKPSQTLRFGLSHLVPELGPVELNVQVDLQEGRYLLSRPRLSLHNVPAQVENFKILLNGKLQSTANRWELVKASLLPTESPLLSAEILEITAEKEGTDELSIGIGELKKREPFACQNLEAFRKDVLSVLPIRSCYRCHGGGPATEPGEAGAKRALNMEAPDEELCRRLLVRGNGRYAVDSPLIVLPLHGALQHPRALPFASEVLPAWAQWITSEKVH